MTVYPALCEDWSACATNPVEVLVFTLWLLNGTMRGHPGVMAHSTAPSLGTSDFAYRLLLSYPACIVRLIDDRSFSVVALIFRTFV